MNDAAITTTKIIVGFQVIKKQLEELSQREPNREEFNAINKRYNDFASTTIPGISTMIMDYSVRHEVLKLANDIDGMNKLDAELTIVIQAMAVCTKLSKEVSEKICEMTLEYQEMGI